MMYSTPFGSIFGADKPEPKETTPKPGFLSQKDDPVSILKRAALPPKGMPQGILPKGFPGLPPKGMPPKGMPPKGMPPKGMPPKGMPPKDMPPKPKKAPKEKKDVMSAMRERFEKKEKVYKAKKAKKIDFKVIAPQFTATKRVVSNNPEVKLEQSKLKVIKKDRKFKILKERLGELKKKTKSAKIYRDILVHYSELKPEKKKEISNWITEHTAPIKKVSATRKMMKSTNRIKEAIKSIDLEIKHYERLKKLKDKGIDIEGKKAITRVSPNRKPLPPEVLPIFKQKVIPMAEVSYKKLPPQLAGYGEQPIKPEPLAPPMKPVAMKPGVLAPPMKPNAMKPGALAPPMKPGSLPGPKPKSLALKPGPKPKPGALESSIKPSKSAAGMRPEEKNVILSKKSREKMAKEGTVQKIILESKAGKRYAAEKKEKAGRSVNIKKTLEKNLLAGKKVEWQTKRLEQTIAQHVDAYNEVQAQITSLIDKIKQQSPEDSKITTVLGIVAEARPERFVVSASLLDSLKQSFKRLSQLGEADSPDIAPVEAPSSDTAAEQPDAGPEKEAESVLQKTAIESEVALRELETRQHALATVKAELAGKEPPPPPPPPIPATQFVVYLQRQQAPPPKPEAEHDIVKTLNRLLPVVAGFLIIMKFLG
jgi:hypothetical protein